MALFTSVLCFSQEEELKTLKKLYAKDQLSNSDIQSYKSTLSILSTKATSEHDLVYTNFYKGMLPILEINTLGAKATQQDFAKIFSPNALSDFTKGINDTKEFEKKIDKNVYTTDIEETLEWFVPMLSNAAIQLNTAKMFMPSSNIFYSIYQLNKSQGANLENAAILAVQAEDYKHAYKLYEEFKASDYLNNGVIYYATNKASDSEDTFTSAEERAKMIKLGSHTKPRDEKMADKKPEVYKIAALISSKLEDVEASKKAYKEAKQYNPNDIEILTNEANIYYNSGDMVTYEKLIGELVAKDPNNAGLHYNLGFLALAEDEKIVKMINENLDNPKVYDEWMAKRKQLFEKVIPHFEKAYQLQPNNQDYKAALKMCYDSIGLTEKSKALN